MSSELHQKKSNEEKNKEVEEDIKLKRILVPIDGSDYSMRAARYAIELAKLQQSSQIIFIHIIEPFPYDFDSIGSTFDQYSKDVTNIAQSWFSKIIEIAEIEEIEDIKTDVIPAKKQNTIITTIIDYASSNSIDLIVMGTKGRRGAGGFMLGRVAIDVLQHASCPVLLVK